MSVTAQRAMLDMMFPSAAAETQTFPRERFRLNSRWSRIGLANGQSLVSLWDCV